MKIRLRLTLLFTALFAAILAAFALVIYVSYAENREDEYFKRLKLQAITRANLWMEAKVTPAVLQLIYRNAPNTLSEEEVAIYDSAHHLLYHDAVGIDKVKETPAMLDSIRRLKEINFYIGQVQAVGFLYEHNGKQLIITAAAFDQYGLDKLNNLKYTLIIYFSIAIILTLAAGSLFAQRALKPVSKMVKRVEDITATNLDLRVDEGNRRDEIAELAITFNQMLDRLENSFEAQKQFVSNIAHELRTPLATVIAELELSAIKERNITEYKAVIKNALLDAKKMARLANGLLDLAKASYDPSEITFKPTRIDEVLLDARQQILKSNSDYHILVTFEQEIENDNYISISGNEYLLKVAFANLMENGCKFSPNHQSEVTITFKDESTILRFSDNGVGIPAEDLPYLSQPFYRGANKAYAEGNGIGLSLTYKIIQLHKGSITVHSELNKGTSFTIELPHL
ncbi:sensor histidine kinase [Chitinophaga silvatica]|uniref:histidine kinase n=1 Tax=Chitinophaga silvatica TaxID=2282649 RepID=A0A3E1YHW4_9BACT|nr:HAMP domain-containing sensor histidine kinase [Chitinophaga silvatica]RFS26938.1 sensor histidine kinase [Chitinophaga silvatica]